MSTTVATAARRPVFVDRTKEEAEEFGDAPSRARYRRPNSSHFWRPLDLPSPVGPVLTLNEIAERFRGGEAHGPHAGGPCECNDEDAPEDDRYNSYLSLYAPMLED